MNDTAVRQVVRDKLAHGRLPRDRAGAVRATNGTYEVCDVCSTPVSPEDVTQRGVPPSGIWLRSPHASRGTNIARRALPSREG
jgi:hypothetical protein